jgi:uncharacterized membrane protein YdjX (TVP38/TMEM64 family)
MGMEKKSRARRQFLLLAAALAVMTALAALWHFTPLKHWLDPEHIAALAPQARATRFAPLIAIGLYVVGSLVAVPMPILIFVTAFFFGMWQGIAYSIVGTFLAGAVTYWIGRMVGRDFVEHLAGRRLGRMVDRLKQKGFYAVVLMRILPIAPFSVLNMIAGASRIRFRDFGLGTLVGMLPSIFSITIFGSHILRSVRNPSWSNIALLAAIALATIAGFAWLRNVLSGKYESAASGQSGSRVA